MANIGGKFLIGSLTPLQERVFGNFILRPIMIFAIIMLATRDYIFSLAFALVVTFVLDHMLDERRHTCLFPNPMKIRRAIDAYSSNKTRV